MRQALAIGCLMQSGKRVRSGRASVWSPPTPPGSQCMEDGLPLLQVFRPIVDYWPLIQYLLSIERFV